MSQVVQSLPLLLSKEDLTNILSIPQITDDKKVDRIIKEAQDLDVHPLLGDELYYDMVLNKSVDKYRTLLNGEQYTDEDNVTRIFTGLRMAIAYYFCARFVETNQINITTHGVVQKTNEHSTPVTEKTIAFQAGKYRSQGYEYWKQAEQYLNEKDDVYTKWKSTCASANPRSSLKITPIGG